MTPANRARKVRRRAPRTSATRSHRVGVASAIVTAAAGLTCLGIGGFAWAMPQLEPVHLQFGVSSGLGRTPWFSAGSTVFAAVDPAAVPDPSAWGCRLQRPRSTAVDLLSLPDPDLVGSRVVSDTSLTAVVTVGPTQEGSAISCSGPGAAAGTSLWVLPTDSGIPRVPLSIVVAGIALLGVAGLVHPRGRGVAPFGR